MPGFEIRRARSDDRAHIIRLVSEMRGQDAGDRWAWLYRDNPHGSALTWLGFPRDEPDRAVAVASLFPRRVSVDGVIRTGAIAGDCHVTSEARRRGLAARLYQITLAEMAEGGVEFMYGPPTPDSLAALTKAGATRVGTHRRFVRPLSASDAMKSLFRRRLPSGIERVSGLPSRVTDLATRAGMRGATVEELDQSTDELVAFVDGSPPGGTVFPVRDAAFLHWRYFARPADGQSIMAIRRAGRMVAVVVYECRDDVAAVVDVVAANAETADIALQVAVERARSEQRDRIELQMTPGASAGKRLGRRGFAPRGDRVFQVAVARDDAQYGLLTDPSAWFFTEADLDRWSYFADGG